jgi:hypothetical protein
MRQEDRDAESCELNCIHEFLVIISLLTIGSTTRTTLRQLSSPDSFALHHVGRALHSDWPKPRLLRSAQTRSITLDDVCAPPDYVSLFLPVFFAPHHSITDSSFTMARLSSRGRITVKEFASAPAIGNLREIQQAPDADHHVSPYRRGVHLHEGCFLTKSFMYTHQLAHWVNAVRHEDPHARDIVSSGVRCYSPHLLIYLFRRMSSNTISK